MADDTDALFAALEQEDDSAYRAQRIQQLQSELSSKPHHQQNNADDFPVPSSSAQQTVTTLLNHSSSVVTLPNDQSLLDFTTQVQRCVVHFFHPDFARCATMDRHISALADAHGSSGPRFARVDVRNIPFVVEKLKIRVLPCVLAFRDGVVMERVVGFEGLGLGGSDAEKEFETKLLEDRLVRCAVLLEKKIRRDNGDGTSGDEDEEEQEDDRDRRRRGIRTGRHARLKIPGKNDDDDDDWD
ncbi:hypothetical protein VTO42DRAFT_3280 [Malbranchea cinnamomea]